MGDRKFEQKIERLWKQDLSAGTDSFRETLLERCKSVLNADDECALLDDAELELLAAAGDPFSGNEFLGQS